MINWSTKNILNASDDIILQQVNCRGVMGLGLANAIYEKWPNVRSEYKMYCQGKTPRDLLGDVQYVKVCDNKIVANIFGQLDYGHDKDVVYTSYTALSEAFKKIAADYGDHSIAIPCYIGCGLGRGQWQVVHQLIKEYLGQCNVTIYTNTEG